MRILSTTMVALIAITGCSDDATNVVEVGNYERVRVLNETGIEVSTAVELDNDQVLVVCDSSDEITQLQFSRDGDTLLIDSELDLSDCSVTVHNDGLGSVIFSSDADARIAVSGSQDASVGDITADVLSVEVRGNGRLVAGSLFVGSTNVELGQGAVMVDAVRGEELEIDATGGGEFVSALVELDTLDVQASGNSMVQVDDGDVEQLSVDARGTAMVDLRGVMADEADVEATGDTQIWVSAVNSLNIDANGNAEVLHNGDADDLSIDTEGGADVGIF